MAFDVPTGIANDEMGALDNLLALAETEQANRSRQRRHRVLY
jgi:hypothetical protein